MSLATGIGARQHYPHRSSEKILFLGLHSPTLLKKNIEKRSRQSEQRESRIDNFEGSIITTTYESSNSTTAGGE